MAVRTGPLTPGLWIGATVAALILGALCLPFAAVMWRAEGMGALGRAEGQALWFTLWQALASAALSLLLAIPVARALARRSFPGRAFIVMLLGAPFILPVIVAVLGLIAVFGRSGIANTVLDLLGLPNVSIYGAHGVILAHVFFNMPLATRMILQAWQTIPAEHFRLAASLGFTSRDVFWQIEWPMLRRTLPGAGLVIFLICTTSFAVALALGGGPRSTTIELAIYQAFRFDFDLGKAALLALIQLGIGIGAVILTARITPVLSASAGLGRPVDRWDARSPGAYISDGLAISLACVFLLLPLASVALAGLPQMIHLGGSVWAAALRSLVMALISTALTVTAAFALTVAITSPKARLSQSLQAIGTLAICASPLVLGTGLYLLLLPFTNPVNLALPITVFVNALLAIPFALHVLLPAMAKLRADYDRLSASLGVTGFAWVRIVAFPRLGRPLGFAAGLTAALSAGDLGVVTLFTNPQQATLPLKLYDLMGAYRMEDAKAAACLLVALSLGLFWVFERAGRHADA